MSEFYQNQDLKYTEKAVLLEDIILPELPKFPTMSEIHSGNVYYPRTEELYTDMIGKFSIPITTPLNDNYGTPTNKEKTNKPVKNLSNTNLKSSNFKESNFLELAIPKYIVLNFLNRIPKGTEFVVCFVGGGDSLEDIKIIGVYTNGGTRSSKRSSTKKSIKSAGKKTN